MTVASRLSRNMFAFSNQLDNAYWTKTNANVTPDSTTDPWGRLLADTLTTTLANGNCRVAFTLSSQLTYCLSAYLKKNVGNEYDLTARNSGTRIRFNLDTLAITNIAGAPIQRGIETLSNGWYRCWFSFLGNDLAQNDGLIIAGNGDSCYVGGIQLNLGQTMDDYVETAETPRN